MARRVRLKIVGEAITGLRAAVNGGADHIELVSSLGVGWVRALCQSATPAPIHPPEDRVAALSGLTEPRNDTDTAQVARLRVALIEPSATRMMT